jgi:hypothetical protein
MRHAKKINFGCGRQAAVPCRNRYGARCRRRAVGCRRQPGARRDRRDAEPRSASRARDRKPCFLAGRSSPRAWQRGVMRSRICSGSRRAESPVDPTRSQNITVKWRRSAVGTALDAEPNGEGALTAEAACPASLPPQWPQNLAASGLVAPHWGQEVYVALHGRAAGPPDLMPQEVTTGNSTL